MLAVAGIDAFGRIAEEEIAAADEAGFLLEDGAAILFRDSGIDGALVDDDRSPRRIEQPADRPRGTDERPQIGLLVLVHRGRDGDDVEVGAAALLRIGGERQRRFGKGARVELGGAVMMPAKLGDARLVDIEAGHRKVAGERDRQRQADIAEADDRDAGLTGAAPIGHPFIHARHLAAIPPEPAGGAAGRRQGSRP